ncbi:MAG: transposase [Candidatus Electronema sp. V4]|uniref:transposase n=1 Tax=Candidatus Electronema sp. V4 TaxID=3454756 RepID=UPI0040555782
MAGRFEGIFPEKEGRSRGMPAARPRNALNSLLFILATGCRRSSARAAMGVKKSSRRRLKEWHLDGELNELKAMILGIAGTRRMICWNYEAADGSFSIWERRRKRGEIRMQGKRRSHSSACSKPADALDGIETGRVGRPAKKMRRLAADKGYDSEEIRKNLRAKGIHPQIPRKKNASARRGKAVMMTALRFKAERTFSWLQRKVPLARHHCHSDAEISGIDS